ncbi:MAG TPA: AI-2E family transporter, partial [Gemmatimonadales bacterium]|nr:AI-2E family transporter [Gemmatimonadales bacterium]
APYDGGRNAQPNLPMTTSTPHTRDVMPAILGGLLYILLLVALRDVLSPPVVLPIVLVALWPLRDRPGVKEAMGIAVALTLFWALKLYGGLLGPFLVAMAVAYLLAPLVARLESKRIPRGLAIALVVLPPLALAILVAVVAGPQLWGQAVSVINTLPRFATTLLDWVASIRLKIEALPFLTPEQRTWIHDLDAQQLTALLQENADAILRELSEWGLAFLRQLGTLVGFLGYLVVTPVVAFYLLRDWKPLLEWLEGVIPMTHRPAVVSFIEEYDQSLGRFFRGQFIEAALVGVLTGVGLAMLGVPSALLLGAIAGVFNLVPYVGLAISVVPALVVALTMDDPLGGLVRVAVIFGVVQFIDGSVTGPRIVGESVGLHPVVIMLALAFGGAVLGFAGLLLAIPIAVLLRMLGMRVMDRYRASEIYGGT